jgi:parallel beta-helix repeat protein
VEADGANAAYGVLNDNTASPHMSDLSVEVSGAGSVSFGIYNIGAYCAPTILRARAKVEGGTNAYAVYNETEAAPRVTGLICRATGASSSNVALYNISDAAPVMDDVRATVDGDAGAGYALYCNDAQVVVRGLVIEATGGGSSRVGLYVMNDASTVNLSNLTAVITNSSGPAHGAYIRNLSSVTVDHFHLEVQGSVTSSNGFNCGDNTLDLRQGSILVTGGSSITSYGILIDGTGTFTASDVTCDVPATTGAEYGIYAAYASDTTLNNCNIQSGDDGIYSGSSSSTTMELSNCRISGGTYAIHNLSNGAVSVGSSMLADTVSNAGTLNCYQCFTTTMTSACP